MPPSARSAAPEGFSCLLQRFGAGDADVAQQVVAQPEQGAALARPIVPGQQLLHDCGEAAIGGRPQLLASWMIGANADRRTVARASAVVELSGGEYHSANSSRTSRVPIICCPPFSGKLRLSLPNIVLGVFHDDVLARAVIVSVVSGGFAPGFNARSVVPTCKRLGEGRRSRPLPAAAWRHHISSRIRPVATSATVQIRSRLIQPLRRKATPNHS